MILLLLAALASDPAAVVSSLTTQHLAEDCRGKDTDPAATFCTGYIIGVFDTLSSSHQICPSPTRVSTVDATAAARKYIRKHPKAWSRAPAFVVRDALRAAFPCGAHDRLKRPRRAADAVSESNQP